VYRPWEIATPVAAELVVGPGVGTCVVAAALVTESKWLVNQEGSWKRRPRRTGRGGCSVQEASAADPLHLGTHQSTPYPQQKKNLRRLAPGVVKQ